MILDTFDICWTTFHDNHKSVLSRHTSVSGMLMTSASSDLRLFEVL